VLQHFRFEASRGHPTVAARAHNAACLRHLTDLLCGETRIQERLISDVRAALDVAERSLNGGRRPLRTVFADWVGVYERHAAGTTIEALLEQNILLSRYVRADLHGRRDCAPAVPDAEHRRMLTALAERSTVTAYKHERFDRGASGSSTESTVSLNQAAVVLRFEFEEDENMVSRCRLSFTTAASGTEQELVVQDDQFRPVINAAAFEALQRLLGSALPQPIFLFAVALLVTTDPNSAVLFQAYLRTGEAPRTVS